MSLIVTVYVPTGIVLSGDSRTTGTSSQRVPDPQNPNVQITVQTQIALSDAAQKVFTLYGRFGVGTWGDAFVNNMPIAHHIEQFESDPSRTPPANPQALANDLLQYFRSLQPLANVGFLVIGYDRSDPWVISVNLQNNTTVRNNIDAQTNQITYGIVRGGEFDIIGRLLGQPQFLPPFQLMNLQDAVDFSRHLIRSTIDQMRFEPRFPTVGGSIDTLVVTSGGTDFLARKSFTYS